MRRPDEAGKAAMPARPTLDPPSGLAVDTFDEGGEVFALLEWRLERPAAPSGRPAGGPVPPGAAAQREVLDLLLRGLFREWPVFKDCLGVLSAEPTGPSLLVSVPHEDDVEIAPRIRWAASHAMPATAGDGALPVVVESRSALRPTASLWGRSEAWSRGGPHVVTTSAERCGGNVYRYEGVAYRRPGSAGAAGAKQARRPSTPRVT